MWVFAPLSSQTGDLWVTTKERGALALSNRILHISLVQVSYDETKPEKNFVPPKNRIFSMNSDDNDFFLVFSRGRTKILKAVPESSWKFASNHVYRLLEKRQGRNQFFEERQATDDVSRGFHRKFTFSLPEIAGFARDFDETNFRFWISVQSYVDFAMFQTNLRNFIFHRKITGGPRRWYQARCFSLEFRRQLIITTFSVTLLMSYILSPYLELTLVWGPAQLFLVDSGSLIDPHGIYLWTILVNGTRFIAVWNFFKFSQCSSRTIFSLFKERVLIFKYMQAPCCSSAPFGTPLTTRHLVVGICSLSSPKHSPAPLSTFSLS